MAKVIIYSNSSVDTFYEQTQQYLIDKYHTYPSSLLGIPVSEAEAASISYYDAMGRHVAREARSASNTPIGKLVV